MTEIKKMDIYKSSGIPQLSNRLIKDAMTFLITEFTHLANLSINTAKVPIEWKKATVIPIPKVKNSKNVSDLRPISLLPTPGKALEHIIHDRLMSHLVLNKLLSRRQFGFRPGLSTIDAISTLIDDVGLALNNNQLTIATFIDFKKAFDTLDHKLIIKRLAELNLHSSVLQWFTSYLSNRSQTTLVNNLRSSEEPISTGVPQGSILGPLLFIIYVNKLTSVPTNSSILMYADDTVIYLPIDKKFDQQTLTSFQKDLNDISNWCFNNKLSINIAKTQVMILGSTQRNSKFTSNLTLTLSNTPLTTVIKYKYLGLTLTPSLTFEEHFRKAVGIVSAKLNTLSHLRQYICTRTLLLIYKTAILPLMEYANIIYSLVPISLRKKLQRLQNQALKLIYARTDYVHDLEFLHITAKLTTIEQRANRQLILLTYRRAHNPYDYPLLPQTTSTRSSEKMKFLLPRPKYEKFKRFPLYVGSQLWDKLDQETQTAEHYLLFKQKIPRTPNFMDYPV